jgi:hypothetical protein
MLHLLRYYITLRYIYYHTPSLNDFCHRSLSISWQRNYNAHAPRMLDTNFSHRNFGATYYRATGRHPLDRRQASGLALHYHKKT